MAAESGRDARGKSRLCLLLEEYGIPISYDSEFDPESMMGRYFCYDDPYDSSLPIGVDILRNLACLEHVVVGPFEDYIDDDDEEEEYEDIIAGKCYRKMTKEEHEDYNKQINENLGFDVVVPKDIVECGILKPVRIIEGAHVMDTLKHCSKLVVKTYNKIHKTTFMFDKVLKANGEVCCEIYYITFVAVDGGNIRETFQATVYEEEPLCGFHVGFCRIKPQ